MRLILILASLPVPSLRACQCAETKLGKAFEHAAVVFRGRVIRIDHLKTIQPSKSGDAKESQVALAAVPRGVDDHNLVTFRITAVWRGSAAETMRVFAVARPSMCDGYRFQLASEYVVYASKNLDQNWEELSNGSKNGVSGNYNGPHRHPPALWTVSPLFRPRHRSLDKCRR